MMDVRLATASTRSGRDKARASNRAATKSAHRHCCEDYSEDWEYEKRKSPCYIRQCKRREDGNKPAVRSMKDVISEVNSFALRRVLQCQFCSAAMSYILSRCACRPSMFATLLTVCFCQNETIRLHGSGASSHNACLPNKNRYLLMSLRGRCFMRRPYVSA